MSGAEADVSSDGETSFEDEDVPLPLSPLKEGTDEPFQVILKGGSPWGFSLQCRAESKASVIISSVDDCGRAWDCRQLRVGDYLLQVNEVKCSTLQVAQELIDSAFRTLTLLVWRGAGDSLSPPVRSASFLQKTRELSERARQAAVQDDSVLFSESKSASARMKPRQRRIESFHGGRRGSAQSSSVSTSASAATSSTTKLAQHADPGPTTPPTAVAEGGKPGLKGWATEHDLTSSRQPVIMSGSHVTRNVPLPTAKSTPSLNQEDSVNAVTTPCGYSPRSQPVLNMTKSTTDIPEHVNYENVKSPTSPKSPSWYQQKFPNRSVFDFSSSSASRRNAGSPRNSYAGASPRNSYISGSPRNSYASGSPRNSFAGYSSSYVPSNYSQSPVSGFAPMSLPGSMLSQNQTDSNQTCANYAQNQKHSGSKQYSSDDTPTHSRDRSNDRRSLPPQALYQYRQEFQRENKQEIPKPLTSMPVTREEEELDKEIRDLKTRPPSDLDLRPMYSPPAPPVRDISSLKYVTYGRNHEKYPSWPVTAAQPPQNLGPPIDTHLGEKGSENDSRKSESSDKSPVQATKVEAKRSPNVERRASEESKQTRNQSDPGFKQRPKNSFYTNRKPKEPSVEKSKPEGERFDEFCRQSKPGYPPPKLDPDGHNYGDEKYSIPSPPERDVPNLDEKSLVEKIAAVISPNSAYGPAYHHTFQYNMVAENSASRTNKCESATSPMSQTQTTRIPGVYFQQAMNAQNMLRPIVPQTKNMIDSGTSPLQSPNEERAKFMRTTSPHERHEAVVYPEKPRSVIVTQRPYYNTSTQTDDSLANQSEQSNNESGNQSGQGLNSLSSVSSASTLRSDSSSHSSGIGTMTFSDHSSAPMLRKLSEEFYRGKLSGMMPNEKRMSSASTYEELKSPRSESVFGGMKEAESYSSVVIHAHESSGLFGRDELGSSPNVNSKPELSDNEVENYADYRHKPRYSIDSALLQKHSGSMNMPPRGLNEARFTSENNLSGGNCSQRPHSQSLMHLNRPSSSLGEASQSRQLSSSTYSSSSSHPQGSMEARSSGSRISSDSSTKGDKLRNGSDSVFYEISSPPPQDKNRNGKANAQTATIGRKESMKMAYGTYDENEHHYATPYGHQRNSSEVLSPSAHDANVSHGRSASCNDYLPMHYSQGSEAHRLDQIKEEGSEIRWQEAVKKSMSLSRVSTSNYENISPGLIDGNNRKRSDSEKSDSEKKKESNSGLKRFASEQIRTNKLDKKQQRKTDANRSGYSSSSGESTKGSKSDSDNVPKLASQQHLSDSDLKRVQQKALLDFVERKSDKTRSSDSSEPQSPEMKDTSPEFPPPPPPPENTSPINLTSLPPQPSSPFADITKRYNYTKAQRNESLRRTQSITSTSSRDSMSDYMEMKRSERSYQTEWSRLRSQDGATPRRPLSLGSDISGLDQQQSLSAVTTPDGEPILQRSSSETVPKHILAEQDRLEQQAVIPTIPPQSNNEGMVTSPIYHNLSTGDYPRRPPPPVPGINEEPPPALPPRSYHRFTSSKSESYLLSHVDPVQREELQETYNNDTVPAGTGRWDSSGTGTLREDAYAQQLRKQARRFSEQHKPISMQVVSTKSTVQVSLSQSYKQEPAPALEAVPVQNPSPTSSTAQTDVKHIAFHHSPPSSRGRISPEPPPLPTPLKNGETEIAVDLNKTADFPPPPVEFMGCADVDEQKDRCADDSYGSYKTRKGPRELGKYKRATSDTSLLGSHQESFRPPHPELSSRDVVEITPSKPPRKKLELQGRNSPTQGYRSNSPSMHSAESKSANQKPAPQVAAFQATEISTVQHAQKSVAKPLPPVSVQKLTSLSNISNSSLSNISNSSGSFVSTVVQRPAMNQQDRTPASDEPRRTVKDRVKSIEVFAQSPLLAKSQRQSLDASSGGSLSPDDAVVNAADSLEQLESSIKSSDSFKDRLRPVVKRFESEQIDPHVHQERVSSTDASDYVMMTPPVVPSRTYRHKSGDQTEPVYRKNSFQKPRPYENKNSANIHNPLNQNNFINYKQVSGTEHKRNSDQSVPEPQVPTRSQKQNWASNSEQSERDNSNIPSPDSRLIPNYSDENVQNKEHTQIHGVQSGQKRNYESSFSRSRNHSAGSSNNSLGSESHPSDKNVANHPNSYPANTRSEQNIAGNSQGQNMGGTSQRTENRGEHSIEHRYPSHDQRSTGQTRNYTSDSRNQRSDINNVDNHNVHRTNSRSDSNPRINNYHSQSSAMPDETRESKANCIKDQHTPHKEPSHLVTVCHGRQPSAEELECDLKAHELARVLKDSDKQLSEVLTSDSKKVRMQYLDGLLPVESDQGEERRPRSGTKNEGSAEKKKEMTEDEPTSPMPSNYYVSPPKAMIELEIRKFGDQLTQDIGDNDALAQKKEELLQRMIKKVEILRDDKKELIADIDENEALGKQVISYVDKKCCNHQQKDKYRSYIEDIDKIIRLLLKLSGLLARAENTIQGLTDNTNEKIKKMTYDKRDRLYQQHEDAKELKVDIDRRSGQVEAILQECFSLSELDDYHYYIKMKSKYTIQMQELEDKITLGNEQISALQKSIPSKSKS